MDFVFYGAGTPESKKDLALRAIKPCGAAASGSRRGVNLFEPEAYGSETVSLVSHARDPAGRDRRAVKMKFGIRHGNYEKYL